MKKPTKPAAIQLNYSLKKEFWEVKTAQPRSLADLKKRKLLWQDCQVPE